MITEITDDVMNDLKVRYAEPQRAYHTWAHISDMLEQFAANRALIKQPSAFKMAVLFHDAIYNPRSASNEADSAALMRERMKDRASEQDVMCAQELILATQKHMTETTRTDFIEDARLFLDIDLSILGADEARFKAYDAAIRKEYSFVPIEEYCARRSEILQRFLDRPRLYFTDHYHDRLEASARSNLRRTIAALSERRLPD